MVALVRQPNALISGIRHWREILTLMLWIAAIALIVRAFVGDSNSPYGVCYGLNGRSIPCELAEPRP